MAAEILEKEHKYYIDSLVDPIWMLTKAANKTKHFLFQTSPEFQGLGRQTNEARVQCAVVFVGRNISRRDHVTSHSLSFLPRRHLVVFSCISLVFVFCLS
jgi:hypothetical protein